MPYANPESLSILYQWSGSGHEGVRAGHGSGEDASRVVVAPADVGNDLFGD